MNHVVIIGFMGSGKTKVGKRLAQDLSLPFVDIDKMIVKRMNMSVKELFERFGEPYYRALETFYVKELVNDKERKVISLSSSLPVQEQNAKYIGELGTVVYLKGSLETLKKRIGNSGENPMLDQENREEKIRKMLKQYDPVYTRFADFTAVTGERPFEALIGEIEKKLLEN